MLMLSVTVNLSACGSADQEAAGSQTSAAQSQEKPEPEQQQETEQQKASSSETKEKPDTERYEAFVAENTAEKELSRHRNILLEGKMRQSDGKSSNTRYCFDDDVEFLSWDGVGICYLCTPERYMQYKTEEGVLTYALSDDAGLYEETFTEYRDMFPIETRDTDTLVKTEESDGLFRAVITCDNKEQVRAYLESYEEEGYQDGMILPTEMVFDTDSHDLLSVDEVVMYQDGTEYFENLSHVSYDVDIDDVDDFLSDYYGREKETRTVTVTFAAGTAEQHTMDFKEKLIKSVFP